MNKISILFVNDSLNIGGAEKALLNLLCALDSNEYCIELQLLKNYGMIDELPEYVKLLPEPTANRFLDGPLRDAVMRSFKERKFSQIMARLRYSFALRLNRNAFTSRWKYVSDSYEALEHEYDIAISFMHRDTTYFVIEKVHARKKVANIRAEYDQYDYHVPGFDRPYYEKYDVIVTDSESAKASFARSFPTCESKTRVVSNLVNRTNLWELAQSAKNPMSSHELNVVTVANISPQKRYDLAVETCALIRDQGIDICWYAVGEGKCRDSISRLIKAKGLEDNFVLVGSNLNPYPYMLHSDVYVQTSDTESYCLALEEACCLQRPIVSTNFGAANDRLGDYTSGWIAEKNPEALANAILLAQSAVGGTQPTSSGLAELDIEAVNSYMKAIIA